MPIVSTVPFLSRKTQQLHEQWNNSHPYCSINNFPSKLEAHSSRKKWKWKVQGVGSYTRNYMAQFHKPHSNTNNFIDSFIKTKGSRNENQIEDSHKQYLPITWDRGPPESLSKSPSTLCFSLPSCFVFLFLSIPTLVQIFSSPEPARSPLLIFLKLLKFFILFGSFQKPISSNSFLPQSPSGFLSQSLFFSYFSPISLLPTTTHFSSFLNSIYLALTSATSFTVLGSTNTSSSQPPPWQGGGLLSHASHASCSFENQPPLQKQATNSSRVWEKSPDPRWVYKYAPLR